MATTGGGGRMLSDKGAPVIAPKKETQGHQKKEPQVLYDVDVVTLQTSLQGRCGI